MQLNRLSAADITRRLQAEIDAAFPNGRAVVRQLEQGPPFDVPIEVRILGHDLTQLQEIGETDSGDYCNQSLAPPQCSGRPQPQSRNRQNHPL